MVTLYTIILALACCVAVALAIRSEWRGRTAESSWITPSTLALLAATCATQATLAYAMSGPSDENLFPLLIGDVSMPLSIGLLLGVVRVAAGKKQTLAVYCVVISLGVGATTLLASPEAGQAAKLLVLTVFSWMTAFTCLRERLPRRAAWLIGISTALYGTYCLLRFSSPLLVGDEAAAAIVGIVFARGTATIVAAALVAVIAWGVIDLIGQSQTSEPTSVVSREALTNWIGALLAQRSEVAAVAVSVPDLALHRAAFGRVWAQTIVSALGDATRAGMPPGSIVGRVTPGVLVALLFSPVVDLPAIQSRLQESYTAALPATRPTEPPDLRVELLSFSTVADLRRFARQSATSARDPVSSQGG